MAAAVANDAADVVEHMTGARVRERVPDWVVRKADQIELVDSSPEQLRRRMIHGNIYPKERVSQALTHFFRTDNLIALRELALRFLADEADEELLEHLRQHDSQVLWETTNASWSRSPRSREPTCCCDGRRAWRPGSRGNSTWSTSAAATPAAQGDRRPVEALQEAGAFGIDVHVIARREVPPT